MYELYISSQFKKDIKAYRYKSKIIGALQDSINDIRGEKLLSKRYNDHELKGTFAGVKDCHIFPDVLLVYEIDKIKKCLRLIRLGSHSELFG
ncbi:MAG TPA: type II toxin-antitoxin system YafQ family toxin [Candidatus Absconditabacterales bacterium]|nr:type II toxin-antitoxin system YafQ family toxin [Candidatus Absconditabacterales bacterium]